MAFPIDNTRLVGFSTNFNTVLSNGPEVYQLTIEDAAAYNAVHVAYLSAQTAVVDARDLGRRDKALTAARDAAKANLLSLGRSYYAAIQKNPAVTDEAKTVIGVHVIDSNPQPEPTPMVQPIVEVLGVVNRTISLKIQNTGTAAKPPYAMYNAVYTYVGETYPADPSAWYYHGGSGQNERSIIMPADTQPGAVVWVLAMWMNRKLHTGPASTPTMTRVQGGGVNAATTTMRMAA